jgi:hypothetical protein
MMICISGDIRMTNISYRRTHMLNLSGTIRGRYFKLLRTSTRTLRRTYLDEQRNEELSSSPTSKIEFTLIMIIIEKRNLDRFEWIFPSTKLG